MLLCPGCPFLHCAADDLPGPNFQARCSSGPSFHACPASFATSFLGEAWQAGGPTLEQKADDQRRTRATTRPNRANQRRCGHGSMTASGADGVSTPASAPLAVGKRHRCFLPGPCPQERSFPPSCGGPPGARRRRPRINCSVAFLAHPPFG